MADDAVDVAVSDEDAREDLARELEGINAELARRSLKEFARQAWVILEPSVPLVWNWHLDVVCSELEAVTRGENDRVGINVPPGTMKSLLVSVIWPAWEWASAPQTKYLAASYGADLSQRDTLKMRDLVSSAWYQRVYALRLRDDQAAKTWFINAAGGWRIATSTKGRGTGEHPDRIIIDDPHSADQARSEAERKAAIDWFDQTMSTRGATRGVRIVLIMQRLHEDDLTGHLRSVGGWRWVVLPMRFDPERADPLDRRTKKGELLWPELFPEEKLRKLEIALGPYGTAGQMQQRPAPQGGGLFKRAWFKLVDRSEVPKTGLRRTRGWDTAATEGEGDFTVGAKLALHDSGDVYVEDVARGQWGPARVDSEMKMTAARDGRLCRVREEQEPGSAGKTVCAKRKVDLTGYDYDGVPVSGDKQTRAGPFRSHAESGRVLVVRAEWNEAFFAELESFPNAVHDDQVDGTSCAYNDLTGGPRPARVVRASWG